MKFIGLSGLIAFLLSIFGTTPYLRADENINLNTLKDSEATSSEEMSNLSLYFESPLRSEQVALSDHGTFLQIDIKNAVVTQPGKFRDGAGPFIKKYVAFQSNPKDLAIRVFVDKDAASVKASSYLDVLDNKVLLAVQHKELNSLLAATTVSASTSTPADEATLPFMVGQAKPNLKEKLIPIGFFSAFMLLLLIAVLFLKPWLRKRITSDHDTLPTIKTLSMHNICAKQKLAIIRVGDEDLLLSIGPTGMSLIRNLSEAKQAKQNLKALMHSPQRTVRPSIPSSRAGATSNTGHQNISNDRALVKKYQDANSSTTHGHRQVELPVPNLSSEIPNNSTAAKRSIDDVTKIIREKLKNLPSMA